MLELIRHLGRSENDDLFNTCCFLLKSKNILYSDLHLKSLLTEHIHYPSLLTIQDALLEYEITSIALYRGEYSYHDFEFPFICAIQKDRWSNSAITIVVNVLNDDVHYLDPLKNKVTITTIDNFQSMHTGSILLIDTSKFVNEKNLRGNKAKERKEKILTSTPLMLIILSFFTCAIYIISHFIRDQSWISLTYLATTFAGVLISLVLISHEVDEDNKLLKQVCGTGGKTINCSAVLSSAYSSAFGVSWSIWGGAYFIMLFLIQSLFVNNLSYLMVTATMSVLLVPFTFYSIYLQWQIIKQWCLLCLGIHALLVINAYISIYAFTKSIIGYQHHAFQPYSFILTFIIAASVFITLLNLIPILKSARDRKFLKRELEMVKSDKNIFFYFLNKGDLQKYPPDDMGFKFGNPSASDEIIAVCNPYCRYCAIMHTKMNKFLEGNTNVSVRIIFKVSDAKNGLDRKIVDHFLNIHKKYGTEALQSALDYWYSNVKLNIDSFINQFVVDKDSNQFDDQIENMNNWTDSMNIRVTPTLLFNGYKVPLFYDIDDLNKILKFSR